MVEQHLVSIVKLGVGFPCIEFEERADPLVLRTDRKTPYRQGTLAQILWFA